jgi:hypothetical protein
MASASSNHRTDIAALSAGNGLHGISAVAYSARGALDRHGAAGSVNLTKRSAVRFHTAPDAANPGAPVSAQRRSSRRIGRHLPGFSSLRNFDAPTVSAYDRNAAKDAQASFNFSGGTHE